MSETAEDLWKTCSADGCDSPANVQYYWPGKDRMYACLPCSVAVRNVANAIGLPLLMEMYRGEEALRR